MTVASRATLVLVVAIGLSLGLGSFCLTSSADGEPRALRITRASRTLKPAPRARPISDEEMRSLLKRDGTRPLLVNYWATWCDPCRDEFPDLVKIDKEYRAKGLDFIAITLDDLKDLQVAVPRFLRSMKAQMPVYLLNEVDPEPAINFVDPQWGGSLPATFLYNSKGEVVYKHFGRFKTDELRTAIEKVMSDE